MVYATDQKLLISLGTDHSPSEGSRCSSSMGYLEPRPHDESGKENPKVVQKKLLETVITLNTESTNGGSKDDDSSPSLPDGAVTSPDVNSPQQAQTPSSEKPSQSLSAPP